MFGPINNCRTICGLSGKMFLRIESSKIESRTTFGKGQFVLSALVSPIRRQPTFSWQTGQGFAWDRHDAGLLGNTREARIADHT